MTTTLQIKDGSVAPASAETNLAVPQAAGAKSALQHRMNESGFQDKGPLLVRGQKIEDLRRPEDTFDIFPADSAQAGVLAEAATGNDLLVTGAAGTGKSVTIANLLSNSVARHKSILLFAPTDAALQTVEKWLERAGLGHLCLRLSRSKNDGEKFLESMALSAGQPRPVELPREETIHKLKRSHDRMNEYSRIMGGEFRKSGLTPWQIITEYIRMESLAGETDSGSRPDFDCPEIRSWDADTFKKVVSLLGDLEQHLSTRGSPVTHLFFGAQLSEEDLNRNPQIKELISKTASMAKTAREGVDKLFLRLGLRADLPPETLEKTLHILDRVAEYYTEDGAWFEFVDFNSPELDRNAGEIRDCLSAGRALGTLRANLRKCVRPEAFQAPNLDRLKEILALESSSSAGNYSKEITLANELLTSICQEGKVPAKTKDKLTLVSELIAAQEFGERILERKGLFEKTFGARWVPDTSSPHEFWNRLEFLAESSIEYGKILRNHPAGKVLEAIIHNPEMLYCCDEDGSLQASTAALSNFIEKRKELTDTLKFSREALLKRFGNADLTKQQQILCDWEQGFETLSELCRYQQKFGPADIPGLPGIIEKAERWNLAGAALVDAIKENWLYGLMNDFLTHCPLARQFEPALQNQYLNELIAADRQFRLVNSSAVSLRHWDNQPHMETGGQHKELLDLIEFRETDAPPPSEIIQKCPAAVLRQAPIVLATPADMETITAFPASAFDLLICDEASQLTAEAIMVPAAKAKQLVAFGDEAQLAPENQKSLIDHLTDQGMARRELPVHYRSLDGMLLDPVNRTLYSNSIKTFPNALRHGSGAEISLERVSPGEEAQKTAQLVAKHARTKPEKSLAVLTLDQEQAASVERALDLLSKEDKILKTFLARRTSEPFQALPVELFQGNERDCVIAALALPEAGKGNFGPISREGGEKMLNVLASRPREELLFVTSADPENMKVSPGSPAGEKLLRRYLITAEKKTAAETGENTAVNDALQDSLKDALEKRGLTVVTNVGSSTLGVDIAIVDPNDPGRFILGILTDGGRSSRIDSALEREVIIPDELKRRGWNIRQLWCLEYLNQPEQTVSAIADQVFSLAAGRKQAAQKPLQAMQLLRESATASADRIHALVPPYRKATVSSGATLEKNIAAVIAAESPIHQDEILRRLAAATGVEIDHQELVSNFASTLEDMAKEKKLVRRDGFACSTRQEEIIPRNRSKCEAALRKWQTVSPEERQAALCTVLKNACHISAEELPKQVWKLLGLAGAPEGFDAVISQDIEMLGKQNT